MLKSAGTGQSILLSTIDADVTGANSNTAQNWLPATQDTLTVSANTAYLLSLFLSGDNGATTCTKALGFAGSATIDSIRYYAIGQSVAINSAGATQSSGHYTTAAATVVLATGATAWWIRAVGMLRVTTGGTIIPQLTFSADPTGTVLFRKNSFILLTPVGADPIGAIGPWS